MRYARAILPTVALLVGWGCVADAPPATGKGKEETKSPTRKVRVSPHVHASPVPLVELVREADRIFVGEVQKIAPARLEDPALRNLPVEKVSFDVHKVLKGDSKKSLSILQAASIGVFRVKTGRLLIYLSPNSKAGLTQPIGISSGYFRLRPDPSRKGKSVAVNLLGNEGLWGEAKWLVGDEAAALKALQKELSLLDLTAQEQKLLTEATMRPEQPGPLPEELLIAATRALVGRGKGRD
jgi:hypothetical protein